MRKVGSRIFAVQQATADTVWLYGVGTYVGDEVPPEHVDAELHQIGLQCPRLVMDSGLDVWGFECWWGPEESYDKFIQGRAVYPVPPPARGAVIPTPEPY